MKRKHGMEGEGGEGNMVVDEEEEKINTFYTLGKGKAEEKEMKSTWTPSFTWEDFAEEDHHEQFRGNFEMLPPPPPPPPSYKNIDEGQQPTTDQKRQDQDLDLNLSL
ncbi:hypothetical protein NC653_006964 [Populus alba x Populus x berolinensis]|uniref:Uncharacterized protein n=1 Tax=Populus alba x Populus x berolinensis TaxID=444605 RepID=A0AAD6WF22_9ROSI|nr:hypothetical protein NC653_006964 [Populus alba x Populus x berolinensis]